MPKIRVIERGGARIVNSSLTSLQFLDSVARITYYNTKDTFLLIAMGFLSIYVNEQKRRPLNWKEKVAKKRLGIMLKVIIQYDPSSWCSHFLGISRIYPASKVGQKKKYFEAMRDFVEGSWRNLNTNVSHVLEVCLAGN